MPAEPAPRGPYGMSGQDCDVTGRCILFPLGPGLNHIDRKLTVEDDQEPHAEAIVYAMNLAYSAGAAEALRVLRELVEATVADDAHTDALRACDMITREEFERAMLQRPTRARREAAWATAGSLLKEL